MSTRDSVHVLAAAAESFGHDPKDYVLNHTSIWERRKTLRRERYQEFRDRTEFPESSYLMVHWDGKLLPALTGTEKVDRLAILVSFNDKEQLLGVPQCDGSGLGMAETVYGELINWDIAERIVGMCVDTTASNTGKKNGACVNLERLLERNILYFPCRHHMFETVLRGVFDALLGPTSGPDTPLFRRFKESWAKIDRLKVKSGMEDETVSNNVLDVRGNILQFVADRLHEKQFRDDYKEFLELTALFLNADFCRDMKVRSPGAIHHARWMAKALYSFKIYLFRDQFELKKHEISCMRDICVFLVRLYVKAWFTAPFAIEAPYGDFLFLKSLIDYKIINAKVSEAAVKKFVGHLWYLSPEIVTFSLFDLNVPFNCKKTMSEKILMLREEAVRNEGNESAEENDPIRFVTLKVKDADNFCKNNFDTLITELSLKIFDVFGISYDFLKNDPSVWSENADYQKAVSILKGIRVVNDVAERGVKLMSDYNDVLTKDESQKQYLLQVVGEYKKKYPDAKKSTLTSE